MIRIVVRRVAASVLVVLGVLTIIFIVVRIVPGDPAALILGASATQQEIDELRENLGLNQPLLGQYVEFMGRALRLDFGRSYLLGGEAITAVLQALPANLMLAATAMVLVL